MLRQFVLAALALLVAACGIKGPLRLPAEPTPASAGPSTNPEARPPLLPSQPPSAIVPPEPAKKP